MQRRSHHERGLTLSELARRHDCQLRGEPDARIHRASTLAGADAGSVAFFLNQAYLNDLRSTGAGAVILSEPHAAECPVATLITPDPYRVFAGVADELHALLPPAAGIDADATVSADASVDGTCEVAAGARVAAGATLARGVYIGPNATVGPRAQIGADSRILPNSAVCEGVTIGKRCLVHPGAVLGSDGFGNAPDAGGRWRKIPQLGAVRIGDDVEIGANTTIDRGALEDTVIGDGVRLDNLIQIGHNVVIGEHTAMAAGCLIAGSAKIGRRCRIAGNVGVAGHIDICDDVVLLARTVVTRPIRKPGAYAGSMTPMEEVSSWRRNAARFKHLDALYKRVLRLERSA
ncbi:MAG: UDP-3-O-(3-hydroxymyristoyl)glucosamine N-acyltransferase [Gammaproteobacteria bacterium]|nr:UDP-3-O-(3-hydroxymyristoyl)glucosamine N-acyltransferase [Gammaproteobacteria bacterium]MYF67479.1 UDP-3-O-(3-hydroxymyristoyl)glucosamine N-acyltransferase [Gammaproteobacteria bacterium]MYK37415.1 UDP-3-O-(3-hydroxymyristoyl)glucosamine N-acyltransferase [Gammaproteobacteria bacterium]